MIDISKMSMMNVAKLYDFLQRNQNLSRKVAERLWKGAFILGVSYVIASSLTSFLMVMLFNPAKIFPPQLKITSSSRSKCRKTLITGRCVRW